MSVSRADGSLPVSTATRIGFTVLLSGVWAAGYFSIGTWTHTLRTHHDPSTRLDAVIPFVPWAVWPYLLAIAWIAAPAALIRSVPQFRRTAISYFLVLALSLLCFAVFPTVSGQLREQISSAGCDAATAWAIHALLSTDPPSNLAPSLHVSLSALATAAMAARYPRWQVLAIACLLVVILSVCLLKQHTVVDAVTGLCAAWLALRVADRFTGSPQAWPGCRRISTARG
jgi:hypothetical protein